MTRLAFIFGTVGILMGISSCKKECDLSFIFTDSVFDIEGNTYTTIELGSQTWMASNLTTSLYNSGDSIEKAASDSAWTTTTEAAWTFYDNNTINGTTYGKLYNHAVVSSSKNVCPVDWHVPTKEDWEELTKCTGGNNTAGAKLKDNGFEAWWVPNEHFSTNESTFSALPGGLRTISGDYQNSIYFGYFWTSSVTEDGKASMVSMSYGSSSVNHFDTDVKNGASIRCIKD